MFDPSSTHQMLSCGSTLTACAKASHNSLANLANEFARAVEFKQSRRLAARIHEDMALGIRRHPNPSPRKRLGGIFRKLGTDSNEISGTFCAFGLL